MRLPFFSKAPKRAPVEVQAQFRSTLPQGPFTTWFKNYVPRVASPELFEVLRLGIPVLGAAVRRLSSLTGVVKVQGDKAALVDEITEWLAGVQVNDFQQGFQSYMDGLQNETFEQGFGMGEYVFNKTRTDITSIRVGDSKLIHFVQDPDTGAMSSVYRPRRPYSPVSFDPSERVRQILNGVWTTPGYFFTSSPWDVPINMVNKQYLCYYPNNQDPHGESLFSSLEFVSEFLLTIINANKSAWERFGDPSFQVVYKTTKNSLQQKTLDERRDEIAKEFTKALSAKKRGESGDFVQALDKDSTIELHVIGADGKVLQMEVPYRACVEQVSSKTGLPLWMLGISGQGSNTGTKEAEVELVLADATGRQNAFLPGVKRMVTDLLLARGRSWRPKDWEVYFESPHLHDLYQTAQANFLNAQARLMESGAGTFSVETQTDAAGKVKTKLALYRTKSLSKKGHHCHEHQKDRSPEVEAIKAEYYGAVAGLWSAHKQKVLDILNLPSEGKAAFGYTPEQLADVKKAVEKFIEEMIADARDKQGPLVTYTGRALSLGFLQAAEALGKERPLLDLIKNKEVYRDLVDSGFQLVRDKATRFHEDEIKAAMERGMANGVSPKELARELAGRFDGYNSDWERLTRSEVALAQETGKINEWGEQGVKRVKFSPAAGACTVCLALAGEYPIADCPVPMADTHPRCTCAITLADSEL